MPRPRELHDAYFRKAKAEGYLARSAYKLKQIQEKRRVLRAGDAVLDLGCAPGSWMQVAAEIVGRRGVVVGIDLTPVTAELARNVTTIVGDATTIDPALLLAPARRGSFTVVLSDMAPNTTGAGDHYRSVALCRSVLVLLPRLLMIGGNFAMKVFEGEEYPALLKEAAALFRECRGLKPDATRDLSKEIYIVGIGFKGIGGPPPAPPPAKIAPAQPAPSAGWSTRPVPPREEKSKARGKRREAGE